MLRLLVPLLVAFSLLPAESAYIAYNTTPRLVAGKINVHLVPHTHDDVGWLKTVDQYYVGSHNDIQKACVQNVLDSAVSALQADKNRRFVYAEQAFFQRWWRQQSDEMKKIVKRLVHSGQLEFINGGICMHDEATTHYIDMIDQTTLGHRFIKHEFNKTPRIGWQIDPFGHSAVQAYLLSAQVGFDALFFWRIDYQDMAKRRREKNLEIIWRGSRSLGSSADIFTGILSNGYEPPSGFYFEVNDNSILVQDDIDLFDYNVQERVDAFVEAALAQANITRTNHVMWTMGTDFKYQYATTWFRQLDKLIHYVNQDGRVNALYSTPSTYVDAKHSLKEPWPLKTEDFFPYADREGEYWTGYFTSRPALKGYVRTLSAYYLAARQLEFLRGRKPSGSTTDSLADALAIAQHHDAITGTEKQHVADDYAKRLAIGYTEAEKGVASSLACLSESTSISDCQNPSLTKFEQCPLLNISYCPPSEAFSAQGKSLAILVYNSLGWRRDDIIRIPVSSEFLVVRDSEGKHVESQLTPISDSALRIREFYVEANLGITPTTTPKFWLIFPVSVPPLGFSTYFASAGPSCDGSHSVMSTQNVLQRNENASVEIGQGNVKLIFSDGRLDRYVNSRSLVISHRCCSGQAAWSILVLVLQDETGHKGSAGANLMLISWIGAADPDLALQQSYSYYLGKPWGFQASGAYIFVPGDKYDIQPTDQKSLKIVRGPIVDEVHQLINPWIHQITRLYKGKEHVEFEYIVGPIPVDDRRGKEVVTHITTNVQSNKTFYTDSNGRDFIRRIRDHRPDWDFEAHQPISGNYYPVNLGIYMEDDETEVSVLVDRPLGGSSILDGQVELMLHRRLVYDDGRGVDEALDETVCLEYNCEGLTIHGKYYVRIDPSGHGAKWRRSAGQEIYSPLLLAFSEQNEGEWRKSHVPTFTALDSSYTLSENVAIITLQELEYGSVLLRLAHLYEVGEDKDHSTTAKVYLKKLFKDREIKKATEMNLSGNREREEMEKERLAWIAEAGPSRDERWMRGGPVDPTDLVVELFPMEIRTFIITFRYERTRVAGDASTI